MVKSAWSKTLNTLQVKPDYSERPVGLKWRSNTFFIVATVAVGLFTDLWLYSLVVPILPFMLQDRVGVPRDQIQSHVDGMLAAYAAASVCFSPIAGILADRVSTRQAPFLLGVAALFGATVLLFLGTTVPVLALARVLQGVSSAVVWTLGLALCIETVGPENLGKTIGSIFSFISAGTLAAPTIGGVLYEKSGLGAVAAVGYAVLIIDFLLRAIVIEKKVARRYGLEDSKPAEGGDEASNEQQNDDQNGESGNPEEEPLLSGRGDPASFKLSKDQPKIAKVITILPCMSDPRLLVALLVALVQATILGSFDATIPTVANELFGFNSLKAGLLFLPLGLLDFLLGPVFGWAVDRFGTKPISVFTYTALVPILTLLRLPHAGGMDQILLYGGLLALCGIGLSGIGAPSIVEAGGVMQKYHETNPEHFGEDGPYAQLYGMNSMVFNAGLTIGPVLSGELKEVIGYGNMNLVLAVVCAITAVLCFIYMGGKPRLLRGANS